MDDGVRLRIGSAQCVRMNGVSSHSLDAVKNQLLEVRDLLRFKQEANRKQRFRSLRYQPFDGGCGLPRGGSAKQFRNDAIGCGSILVQLACLSSGLDRLVDEDLQTLGIKIYVGQCGEDCVDGEG